MSTDVCDSHNRRGTPSAYPTGIVAIKLLERTGRRNPYDTASPASIQRRADTRERKDITGISPEHASRTSGPGNNPYKAMPMRAIEKRESGTVSAAALFAA